MYSASKAGLELFYESLSLELAYKQIKCSIVQPGNVNTGFNETGNDYEPIGNEFDVNLVSHVKFVRDVIPFIRDGGRIIAVSSLSATVMTSRTNLT